MAPIFFARAAQELGLYASPEAIRFWALCLGQMETAGRCSLSGTPEELAREVGYEGDAALAVCLLHDLGSRAATVLILHDESDTLDPALAVGVDRKSVLLVSGTRQAALRRRVSNRKRVAAQRNGGRESGACFPASSAWAATAASRPRQLALAFRDEDHPQHSERVKKPASVVDTRAGGVGGFRPPAGIHNLRLGSDSSQVSGTHKAVPGDGTGSRSLATRGSAVARNALHGQASDHPEATARQSARAGSDGSAERATAERAPYVTFNNQVSNVTYADRAARRRNDDRQDLGAWELADRLEVRRIANAALEQLRDRIKPNDFGDRRLFVGIAALVVNGCFKERQYLQVLQGAARSERPAAYVMAAFKRIAWKEHSVDFNGMLNAFKYPAKLVPEQTV